MAAHIRSSVPRILTENERIVFIESVVVLMAIWWFGAQVLGLSDVISSPVLVGANLYELFREGGWVVHVVASFRRVFIGLAVTLVLGTFLGIVFGMSRFWEGVFTDYITVGMMLPALLIAVFMAMWFGQSDIAPAAAAAATTFPYITQSVAESVKNIDVDYYEMSNSFDVPRRDVIRHVIVPSIAAGWFAGLRFSFSIIWKVVNLAELIVSNTGIGSRIHYFLQIRLSLTGVLTWVFIFLFSLLIMEYLVIRPIEQRVFAWRSESGMPVG